MLRTLYQLAQEEQLIADSSFEMKPVAWTIVLNPDGTLAGDIISNKELGPQEFTSAGKEKKRRELTKRLLIPRQFVIKTGAGRTSGAYAYFLVDKADYVFGFAPDSPVSVQQVDKKLIKRRELFIQNVVDCYESTQLPKLQVLLIFLTKLKEEGLPKSLPESLTSNDQFAFKILPDLEAFIHEDPAIVEYWQKLSNPTPPENSSVKTCLVTGKQFTKEALFPGIKRVPGGTTSGAGLVSFNSKVFESHGWDNSENATISPRASQAIATALNRLMDPAFETQNGNKLPRRYEVIAKDTVIAYWPKGFWIDPLDENHGSFSNLLASSWKGIKSNEDDASPFHAFTLSGSQGRIIVRDYFETTAFELYENLKFHMESLETSPLTSPAKGKDLPPLYGTNLLLQSTVLGGKMDHVSPPIAVQFYQAIHKGKSYKFPESLIHKALARSRTEIHDDSWSSSYRGDIRSALLKAYLIRNHKYITIQKAMNPEEDNIAYLFGRILSCYGEMQRLANRPRTVNADLTTKHYGKFFARPLASYAGLGDGYNRHYKTALKNKGGAVSGLAQRLNNEFQAIQRSLKIPTDQNDQSGSTFAFSTKEQALFTLGFHHQNLWNKQSSEDRIAWIQSLNLDPYDPKLIIAPLKQPKTNSVES
jgi:CRISPR-associated protein Csd1